MLNVALKSLKKIYVCNMLYMYVAVSIIFQCNKPFYAVLTIQCCKCFLQYVHVLFQCTCTCTW